MFMQLPSTWPPLGYGLLAVISGTHIKLPRKKKKKAYFAAKGEQDRPCSQLEAFKCNAEIDSL